MTDFNSWVEEQLKERERLDKSPDPKDDIEWWVHRIPHGLDCTIDFWEALSRDDGCTCGHNKAVDMILKALKNGY